MICRLYLTTLRCSGCEGETVVAHGGPKVPRDHDAPWPNVDYCPQCGEPYPDDLGVVMTEVMDSGPVQSRVTAVPTAVVDQAEKANRRGCSGS